ncbi:MAG: recombinase family protein [Selenomonadaceae bacterium]|nr:recombinase family protein [Selenomonadaceae bacterium]
MPKITMIPARARTSRAGEGTARPKQRVAAYCRVSTDTDEQATSYEAQIEHYTTYIQSNPAWAFAGIYADEGISGTSTKKREDFNRMIDDCMAGKVDLVITKSISRFARNTLDCLKYIRKLKAQGIAVFFEKENINTLDAKGEILLTIMASLAQQESQSLSQNVRMGIRYRYQQGKVRVCTTRFLGYDKGADGELVINPEEAKVVKRIYREYLEGESYSEIGAGLEADGIRTAAGGTKWRAGTLIKILTNEKYIGDALLQKTVTTDFLSKKRVKNKGIVPQYYVEGDHEAIIPKELFLQVKMEMERRAHIETKTGKRRVYSSKYALSSLVYCGHCGDLFRRIIWQKEGGKRAVWRCVSRVEKKKAAINCKARTLPEAQLHDIVVQAIREMFLAHDDTMQVLTKNLEKALDTASIQQQLETVRDGLAQTQQDILQAAQDGKDIEAMADKLDILKRRETHLEGEAIQQKQKAARIREMKDYLAQPEMNEITYDETLVRKFIEKITVHDDRCVVRFKSGVDVTVMG